MAINGGESADQNSARCHPIACIRKTRTGGARAEPTCPPNVWIPWARPQRLITRRSSSPAVKADALVVVKHDIRPLVVRVDRNQSVTLPPHRRHTVQGILSREYVESSGGERIDSNTGF